MLNAHHSDILQREAEKQRAPSSTFARPTWRSSRRCKRPWRRLKHAQDWAETYERDVLPDLEKSLKEIRELFNQPDSGVDALHILDVQRKALTARDGYLDAQFEVRQAAADLAAALGDPSIAVGPCKPSP